MKIKKLLCAILCVCLILPAFFMVGCGDEPEKTTHVMQLSLNPEVEFVLNEDNKVVTVNALNEDGYAIVSAGVDFSNLTAEEAAKKFLEIAKDKKFIVSGNEKEIKISISGEDANALYESVKNNAQNYLSGLNITGITFNMDAIDKEDLISKVQEAFGEYSQTALENMSEKDLINLIKQSREETKNILNKQTKDLYYALRDQKILEAQFKIIADNFSTYFASLPIDITVVTNMFTTAYNTAVETIKSDFANLETTLNNYVAAKETYLQAQANGTLNTAITANYNLAKENYEEMKEYIEKFEEDMNSALASFQLVLGGVLNNIPDALKTSLATAQSEATTALQNAFKTSGEFAGFNISGWNNAN